MVERGFKSQTGFKKGLDFSSHILTKREVDFVWHRRKMTRRCIYWSFNISAASLNKNNSLRLRGPRFNNEILVYFVHRSVSTEMPHCAAPNQKTKPISSPVAVCCVGERPSYVSTFTTAPQGAALAR